MITEKGCTREAVKNYAESRLDWHGSRKVILQYFLLRVPKVAFAEEDI